MKDSVDAVSSVKENSKKISHRQKDSDIDFISTDATTRAMFDELELTGLEAVIDKSLLFREAAYTLDSWEPFIKALKDAQAILATAKARNGATAMLTQSIVDVTAQSLMVTQSQLRRKDIKILKLNLRPVSSPRLNSNTKHKEQISYLQNSSSSPNDSIQMNEKNGNKVCFSEISKIRLAIVGWFKKKKA